MHRKMTHFSTLLIYSNNHNKIIKMITFIIYIFQHDKHTLQRL